MVIFYFSFVENFFSRLRAIGGDNCHPGPYTALRRIRILLIGRKAIAELALHKPSVALEDPTVPEEIIPIAPNTSSTHDHDVVEERAQGDTYARYGLIKLPESTRKTKLATQSADDSEKADPEELDDYQDTNNEVDENTAVTNFITSGYEDNETDKMEEQYNPEMLEDIPTFENTDVEDDQDIELVIREFQTKAKRDKSFQGLSYLAGYIAYKFKKEFPELGNKTGTFPSHDPNGNRCNYITTWIFHVSKGGLMVPENKFLNYCQLFEQEFLKFHGEQGINREKRILDKLTEILTAKFGQDFNKKVLAFFVKVRTFIRMKTMILEARKRNPNKKPTRFYKQQGQFATSHIGKEKDGVHQEPNSTYPEAVFMQFHPHHTPNEEQISIILEGTSTG